MESTTIECDGSDAYDWHAKLFNVKLAEIAAMSTVFFINPNKIPVAKDRSNFI